MRRQFLKPLRRHFLRCKRHFSECADRQLAKKFTECLVKHTEKFCLMRVPENSKHITRLSARHFYDALRLQARSDIFSLNPFVFFSHSYPSTISQ